MCGDNSSATVDDPTTQAIHSVPLLRKLISFGYQIASGMVCADLSINMVGLCFYEWCIKYYSLYNIIVYIYNIYYYMLSHSLFHSKVHIR